MNLPDRLAISYYQTIAPISEAHKVYLVRHRETGKLYVKKVIDVYSPEIYEYLRHHPIEGVPRIYASCEADGRLIVIEEYISGCTLRDKIENSKKAARLQSFDHSADALTVPLIGRYMILLCEVLEKLHSLDPPLIHRDIKPSNIMITSYNNVILLDFNAARYYSGNSQRESDTKLLGTQGYAAPEQYGFRESSPQTDLFSVGRILKEAVGSLPYEDHTFDAVIAKCTQMEPSKRYASAAALRAALQRCLSRNTRGNSEDAVISPYLPPGFRTFKLWKMIPASLLYAAVSWLSLTLEVRDASPTALLMERIGVFAIFIADILIAGNYLGVLKYAPLQNSRFRLLRLLGTALMVSAVTVIMFVILVFIVGISTVPS